MTEDYPQPLSSHATERERWELVQRIFNAAVEVSEGSRAGFVRRACEGDAELEDEVKALLEADSAAGDYMEAPLVDVASLAAMFEPPLAPGDVLCERFEIVRSIAEGGMGHVFEALDRELHVRVALKVIRPEIAGVAEALARFRQEVRLARTITHPNVCRTYDLDREVRKSEDGREYEVVFLTMELLAGETLAAKIKRDGALKLDEAEALAGQMASALDAAHALGVVHRDMKPANVMLVPVLGSGGPGVRAVITDFGLARIDPVVQAGGLATMSQTSLGKPGQPVGTLAYMAPEQLEGGAVSPATDVYGLGLILFEMVTGRRAFPSENLLSGLTQRLTGAPPAARTVVAGLPARWSYAIEGCLRVKAAERFQRAGEVAAVLAGRRGRLGMVRAGLRVRRQALTRTRAGRWGLVAAAGVLGVSLLAGGVRLYERTNQFGTGARVAAGALVYLAPVTNETGEARLDSVTELLEAGLAQSAQINLLDQGKVGDVLEHMTKAPDTKIDQPIAREIAMRAGAVRVVFATLTGGHGSYRLQMEVQQPDNSPSLFRKRVTKSFAWSSGASADGKDGAIAPELLGAVRDASDWVRHEVGESAGDIARLDVPPEDVTTGSWEALADYAEAERLRSLRKDEEAVTALRSAVAADPAFTLAYARLGDILVSEDDASGYEAYLKALDVQSGHSLSLRERDRLEGIYASDTRSYQTAEDAFREYASLYPADYLGWFYRGSPLMMLNRGRDAVRVLERAHQVSPGKVGAVLELAEDELVLGDFSAANHWGDELRTIGAAVDAAYVHALTSFAMGDFDSARREFSGLVTEEAGPYSSMALRWWADLLAESGDMSGALEKVSQGLKADPENYRLLLDRADLLGRSGDGAGCAREVEAAVHTAKGIYVLIDASRVLGRAIAFAPAAGTRPLEAELAKLDASFPTQPLGTLSKLGRGHLRGEMLLARGDAAGALREFRMVDARDAAAASRDYLVRALLALAKTVGPAEARGLRTEAMRALASVAERPNVLWQWQDYMPPGFYADQLEVWLSLAKQSGADGVERSAVEQRLRMLGRQVQ